MPSGDGGPHQRIQSDDGNDQTFSPAWPHLEIWVSFGVDLAHKLRLGDGTVNPLAASYRRDPFRRCTEALAAGTLNRYQLARHFQQVHRNVYAPKHLQLNAIHKAHAAWLWSNRRDIVAGVSASALHGSLWIDRRLPAELNQASQHKTSGIVLHSDALEPDEVVSVSRIPVTSPARTAFDLGYD